MTRKMILSIASSVSILLAGSLPTFGTLSYGEFPPASDKSNIGLSHSDIGSGEEDCLDEMVNLPEASPAAEEWPAPGCVGGDVAPVRSVLDPYPTFDGIAVDTQNNKVVMSDENRHCLLVYDRGSGNMSDDMTQPARQILGPQTKLGFCAGVALDPVEREAFTVNNDGGDLMTAFSYDSNGDVNPAHTLYLPHQSWGITLSRKRNEIAVSVQQLHGFVVYRRQAEGAEAPLRVVRGTNTGLADPHGIYLDDSNNEIVVANHGNWTELRAYTAYDALVSGSASTIGGRFSAPSITVYPADAKGDAPPSRTIQGQRTKLDWPMGLSVDTGHNEIAVANYGDNSVLIFRRNDSGDVAPVRVIRGAETGITGPVSVAIDTRNDEIWVANYADHSAMVFSRTANGNVAPKRIIRNAPARTPTCGFTNASACAYDPGRQVILVPN